MTIYKIVKPESNFTTIPNATIEDSRLSPEAVGVLARLLAKPDGWEVRAYQVEHENGIRKDARRRIFSELETAGYASRRKVRRENGTFGWVVEIYAVSRRITSDPATGGLTSDGSTVAGAAAVGESGCLEIKQQNNETDNNTTTTAVVVAPSVVAASSFAWPPGSSGEQQRRWEQMIRRRCPQELRQHVSASFSAALLARRVKGQPEAYLSGILRKVAAGEFTPLAPRDSPTQKAEQLKRETEEREKRERRNKHKAWLEMAAIHERQNQLEDAAKCRAKAEHWAD